MDKTETLREKANKLPLLPGVYIMKDDRGEVIYVGKAKALKNRVTSYFRGAHEIKVAAMAEKVEDFDVIVANSEFEALVLENSLIKRHMPRYNLMLRDDKGYPFIRLDTASEYPRFSIIRKPLDDGAKYFGPYGGRHLSREIIDTVSKALGLPTCARKLPTPQTSKERPCLDYHMGICRGWCRPGGLGSGEYREAIKQAEMLFEGRNDELREELTAGMLKASDELRFELAAELRDRLKAVESIRSRQRVIAATKADTDAIGWHRGAKCCFTVLHYVDGDLAGKDYTLLDEPLEEDAEAVMGLVRQYYMQERSMPETILLPLRADGLEDMERLFAERAGRRVRIEVPKRGDRLRLVETAAINAREECERATTARQRGMKILEWLQKALDLPATPERIEAFDVSNTGDFGVVAAMTVFEHGKPLKRDYRKFRIREQNGQNDYGAMREAVLRRFARAIEGDEKFAEVPNLLLIDGGAEHASVAVSALHELGLELPVFGMVKDDRHRTRALITAEGREIGIVTNQAAFAFVGTIQEETHRFAIEYHRSLRSASIGSELDKIKGVGEKRRNELLRRFKTLKAIKAADIGELKAAVPKSAAEAVYAHFHSAERDPGTERDPGAE